MLGQEQPMADECTNAGKDDLGNNRHLCIHCGKTFLSGKALGGHVSAAHVQPGKDLKGQKPKCFECDVEFGSEKALDGHMSAHRKRPRTGKKGMNTSKTNSNQTFDDALPGSGPSLLVDVSEPIFSEHMTGDRRRSQIHHSETRELLKLASCDNSANDKNAINSSQGLEPANQTNNLILELKQQHSGISSGKATANGDGDVTKISTPNKLANYPCLSCNRNFNSHEALGGHSSSHTRKNKLRHVNSIDEQKCKLPKLHKQNAKSSNNSHSGSSGVTGEQGTSTREQMHRCNPCNKNFETHRALKTHERSHLNRHVQVSSSHVATSSNSVEISGPVSVTPSHVTTPNSSLEINGAVCNKNFGIYQALKTYENEHVQVPHYHVTTSTNSVEISGTVPVSSSHVTTPNSSFEINGAVANPHSSAAAAAAASSASEGDQVPPRLRRVLSFDLNQPLEMEDDDFRN